MSFKYEFLKKAVRLSGFRNRFHGSPEEILETARQQNARTKVPVLKDADFQFDWTEAMGFPVLRMLHREKTDRANLFIIGGGMVKVPRPDSIRKALRIAKETGLDLYIPFYPLCTDYPLTKAYEMIHETYKLMLQRYDAKRISVLGTSSGGNLALGIPAYINATRADVPMPHSILTISPGTCVATEEEWARMQALDKKDVLIPAQFMRTAETIMRHGDDSVPEYMIWLQKGDFTNCPKVTFMYGSDETLYAVAPSFEEAMKRYGVPYEMIVGQGLFHCYPVFPIVKEAKTGYDQMIRILRDA